jgi:hypothetical protein
MKSILCRLSRYRRGLAELKRQFIASLRSDKKMAQYPRISPRKRRKRPDKKLAGLSLMTTYSRFFKDLKILA